MNEGDAGSTGAGARFFVDDPDSLLFHLFERAHHVFHLVGHMVDGGAPAALVEEFLYRAVVGGRLQKLDPRFADL